MKPTGVACFVYAGGMSLGVQSSGFDVKHHLENKVPYGADAAKRNLSVEVHPHGMWPDHLDADLWFGNPPCAPFSSAGYAGGQSGRKWEGDPRLMDHASLMARGFEAGAPIVVLESVQRAKEAEAFYRGLLAPGYKLAFMDHDASYYGVCQRRKRTFVVASTVKLDDFGSYADPQAATLQPFLLDGAEESPPAGGRPCLLGALRATLPGEKLKAGWERAGSVRGCVPSVMSARLKWGTPTPTLSGSYGYGHPAEDRFITVAEYRRLCGFPDEWRMAGSANNQTLLYTRGVMPPVAQRLGEWARGCLQNRGA